MQVSSRNETSEQDCALWSWLAGRRGRAQTGLRLHSGAVGLACTGLLELCSGVARLGVDWGLGTRRRGLGGVGLGRGAWTRAGAAEEDDDVATSVDDTEERILQSSFGE